jgi:hypothetical protein
MKTSCPSIVCCLLKPCCLFHSQRRLSFQMRVVSISGKYSNACQDNQTTKEGASICQNKRQQRPSEWGRKRNMVHITSLLNKTYHRLPLCLLYPSHPRAFPNQRSFPSNSLPPKPKFMAKQAKKRRGEGGRVRDTNGGGAVFFLFHFFIRCLLLINPFVRSIRNKIVKNDPLSRFIRNKIFFSILAEQLTTNFYANTTSSVSFLLKIFYGLLAAIQKSVISLPRHNHHLSLTAFFHDCYAKTTSRGSLDSRGGLFHQLLDQLRSNSLHGISSLIPLLFVAPLTML